MALAHITEPLGGALINLDAAHAARTGKSIVQSIADAGGWEAPEEGTERYRMIDRALSCRGMGYRFKGGEGAHDAWSLLQTCAAHAAERDCIDIPREVPGYAGVSEAAARLAFLQWGLTEIKTRHAEPGDVLLFAVEGGVHAAILSAPGGDLSWAMLPRKVREAPTMVHAYPARSVCESWMLPFWTERLIAAFTFDTASKARPFRLEAA